MKSTLASATIFVAVLTLALMSPAGVAWADKPPANATSADVTPTETSGFVDVLHTMVLRKWRKNRILRVDVVMEVADSSGNVIALLNNLAVNGFAMPEGEDNDAHVCTSTDDCTVKLSAWLDLDDAAAFDLAAFKGQPLVIEILGRAEGSGITETRRLRAVAQLIKK